MHETNTQSKSIHLVASNSPANHFNLIQEVALSTKIEQLLSDEVPDTWQSIKQSILNGDYKLFKTDSAYTVVAFSHDDELKSIEVITGVCFASIEQNILTFKRLARSLKYDVLHF